MVTLLRKLFIKNYDKINDTCVREKHLLLSEIVGIICNLILALIKLIIGILSKSISIMTDSINNFSDLSSNVISLVGFKIASNPADKEHPYGHQRIEYVLGLIITMIIIFLGSSSLIESIKKTINNEINQISDTILYVTIVILTLSILVKLWLSFFYSKMAKIINSLPLKALAKDSRNDVISTLLVLIGVIISLIFKDIPISIDGILGVIVSLFIIISAILMMKEIITPLIGDTIKYDEIKEVVDYIKSFKGVYGTHDVMCHKYGPTKFYITIHVLVDSKNSIVESHELIDIIEMNVKKKYNIDLTIHMDPLVLDDNELNELKIKIGIILKEINNDLSFHDFRIIRKSTYKILLFDVLAPFDFKYNDKDLNKIISNKLENQYIILSTIDHKFIE